MKKIKNIVQKILAIKVIKSSMTNSKILLLGILSSNRIFGTLYFFVNFITYNREQYANLKGRFHYYVNLKRAMKSNVALRRNIHRIEKALLMKPLRDYFALEYIDETIDFYKKQADLYKENNGFIDVNELNWAYDVLTDYFKTVKTSTFIKKEKNKFENVDYKPDKKLKEEEKMFPKVREMGATPVKYEDLYKLSLRRRSVRWYDQKQVPRELIDKALLIARQSPTACNRLPFEYRIYDDPTLVKKVSKIPFGAAGYSHNIPMIVVLVGKLDSYFSSRDRHVIYIDASLSAMAFMFALETLGLSSSAINWPDFEPLEMKMQRTLKLKTDERPIMLLSIGYPDPAGKVAYSQKKSLDVLRSYNKIGQ